MHENASVQTSSELARKNAFGSFWMGHIKSEMVTIISEDFPSNPGPGALSLNLVMSGTRAGMAETAAGVKWLLEGKARKRPRLELKKSFLKNRRALSPILSESRCSLILLFGRPSCSQSS